MLRHLPYHLTYGTTSFHLAVQIIIIVGLVCMIGGAILRIRQHASHGWHMLWWSLTGFAIEIIGHPFRRLFKSSPVHWPPIAMMSLVRLMGRMGCMEDHPSGVS